MDVIIHILSVPHPASQVVIVERKKLRHYPKLEGSLSAGEGGLGRAAGRPADQALCEGGGDCRARAPPMQR